MSSILIMQMKFLKKCDPIQPSSSSSSEENEILVDIYNAGRLFNMKVNALSHYLHLYIVQKILDPIDVPLKSPIEEVELHQKHIDRISEFIDALDLDLDDLLYDFKERKCDAETFKTKMEDLYMKKIANVQSLTHYQSIQNIYKDTSSFCVYEKTHEFPFETIRKPESDWLLFKNIDMPHYKKLLNLPRDSPELTNCIDLQESAYKSHLDAAHAAEKTYQMIKSGLIQIIDNPIADVQKQYSRMIHYSKLAIVHWHTASFIACFINEFK